jgi:hypothetical protein
MIRKLLIGAAAAAAISAPAFAAAPVQYGSSYYEFVTVEGGLNWTDANTAANGKSYLGQGGYLATIESAGENEFLRSNFSIPASPSSGPGSAARSPATTATG